MRETGLQTFVQRVIHHGIRHVVGVSRQIFQQIQSNHLIWRLVKLHHRRDDEFLILLARNLLCGEEHR